MNKYEKAMLKAAEDKMNKYQNLYYQAEQDYYEIKAYVENREKEREDKDYEKK